MQETGRRRRGESRLAGAEDGIRVDQIFTVVARRSLNAQHRHALTRTRVHALMYAPTSGCTCARVQTSVLPDEGMYADIQYIRAHKYADVFRCERLQTYY